MVGELKTEKEEGLEEGEALWVKGDGSGVVKREGEEGGRWGGGGGGGGGVGEEGECEVC